MNKIKNFFKKLWDCITFPYYWITSLRFKRKFSKMVEEDKKSMLTEKDLEFLRSISEDKKN